MISLFNNLTEKDKSEAIRDLIHDSTPRPTFFLLVGLSVLMATFGIALGNVSVIIGSMLLAPILSPILSLSLGIVMADRAILLRSAKTILYSGIFGVGLAFVATIFLSYPFNEEVLSRTEPSLTYFAIAFIAGFAVAFARVKPDISETIPGIAISVAIIPPLAVIGMGLARLDWHVTSGAFLFFITNVVGIVFATMIVFSLMNFYIKRVIADAAMTKEDHELKKELGGEK